MNNYRCTAFDVCYVSLTRKQLSSDFIYSIKVVIKLTGNRISYETIVCKFTTYIHLTNIGSFKLKTMFALRYTII